MTLTFITFFTFVVNTGLLVNAKINLQNAADLAAYAGAATQARQLNDISYLNYEMRRQFKKFLFRYYVIGNMAQKSNPGSAGPGGLRLWSPDNNPSHSHNAPVVCIIFSATDNYCQIYSLNAIPINTGYNPLDQLSQTLQQNLEQLEEIRQDSCKAIGYTNSQILIFWLLNTEPNLETFEQEINSVATSSSPAIETIKRALPAVKGLSSGLGLVPRNILLSMRINTLKQYVNLKAQKAIGVKEINQMNGSSADKPMNERPIQAFLSAYHTLGEYTFPADQIEMTEILPESGDEADLLDLVPVKTNFETYFTQLKLNPASSGGNGQDCQATPHVVPMRNVPVGFYKDPTKMTYYAVQFKANVNLPFSPFRKVTLKAYSAAKPFGSRIGPFFENQQTELPFVNPGAKASNFLSLDANSYNKCPDDCYGLPNLPVLKENDGPSKGWNQPQVLSSFYNAMKDIAQDGNNGSFVRSISQDDLEQAYQTAMSPTQSERAKYNILADHPSFPGDIEGRGYPFAANFPNTQTLNHTIWAPLVSDAKTNGESAADLVVKEFEDQLYQLKPVIEDEHINALTDSMRSYIGKLSDCENQSGSVENGECFYATHISHPFFYQKNGAPERIRLPASIALSDFSKDVNTSFAGVNNDDYAKRGRVGYSVKFISFDTLLKNGEDGQSTTGPSSSTFGVWTNKPSPPDDAKTDIQRLKH